MNQPIDGKPQGERPRSEPEIIPPGAAQNGPQMRTYVDTHGTQRIYIAKLGPLGSILVALTTAILSAVMLIMFLGAFLVLIPVIGLLVAAAFISGLVWAYFHRAP